MEKKREKNKHTFFEVRVVDDYNNCKCSKAVYVRYIKHEFDKRFLF